MNFVKITLLSLCFCGVAVLSSNMLMAEQRSSSASPANSPDRMLGSLQSDFEEALMSELEPDPSIPQDMIYPCIVPFCRNFSCYEGYVVPITYECCQCETLCFGVFERCWITGSAGVA